MFTVIEITSNRITRVIRCDSQETAEREASRLCTENGIAFTSPVSADGDFGTYSVTIFPKP